jgi:ribosomal protein S27E
MRHVSISDHKMPDGKINWETYKAAEKVARDQDVAAGVYCYTCGAYLIFSRGGRQQCAECRRLNEPGELTHSRFVRCPACGNSMSPSGHDYYELYDEGDHSVSCPECGHDFDVSTHTSYSFTSPARIAKAASDLEEE